MHRALGGRGLLPIALIISLGGCSSGDGGSGDGGGGGNGGGTPNPETQGTLNVDIEPNSTQGARVIIAGPGGTRSVTKDTSLKLDAGNYSVSVVGVRVPQPIVDDVRGVIDKSAVTIVAEETENVLADYTKSQPGAGQLWFPVRDNNGSDGQVHGFDRDQLSVDTIGPGNIAITGVGIEPINTAFDAGGNLWVTRFNDNVVVKYNAEQLVAPGGSLTPDVTISADGNGSLNGPLGLAFDPKGNMWVGNFNPTGAGANTLVRYRPQQLAQSGDPTPGVKLTGFIKPYGHAFDADGNLWVGNNGADNVLRFPPVQQVNGGAPSLTITNSTIGPLDNPRCPAFNADGVLWISNAGDDQAVAYDVSNAGNADPLVTVHLKNDGGASVPSPDGLAFDNEGNLWVAASDNALYKYLAADLVDGADVQPATAITGYGVSRGVLFSFYPPALDLPLVQ